MHFDFQEKHIRLSVSELADFHIGPRMMPSRRSIGRAAIGQAWHKTLEERTKQLIPEAQFEVPIVANIKHRSWSIEIEGRIDQIIPQPAGLTFREIKTVTHALPVTPSFLTERYVAYVCQAITYSILAQFLPSYSDQKIEAELCFVDIQHGLTQIIPLGPGDEGLFYTQLESIVNYAERSYKRHEYFHATYLNSPFPEFRPEQEALLSDLKNAPDDPSIYLLEAPTGFGKTGVTLYWALGELKKSLFDRIIFLTGKKTGQIAALGALNAILPPEGILNIQAFRSREDHAIASLLHTCDPLGLLCNEGIETLWQKAALDIHECFEGGFFSVDTAKRIGEKTGICPYALSKTALNFSDIWIADYNYIFSPNHQSTFTNQPSFDPSKTLLIVDEAHNLPNRVADALSSKHTHLLALQTLEEMKLGDVPVTLTNEWYKWISFLQKLAPCSPLPEEKLYELLDLAESLNQQIEKVFQAPIDLPGETRLRLWQAADVYSFLIDQRFEKLVHVDAVGQLALTCLDAKRVICPTLEGFKKCLLMSATLNPKNAFASSLGLRLSATHTLVGNSPWRANAYDVAVDMRVDTRHRLRPQAYEITADTLANMATASIKGPAVAFFPSYAYATAVYEALQNNHPNVVVALQPMTKDEASQKAFLKRALEESDIVLLILGSHFSESIDALGGVVSHALVAGPGLPAMDAVQEASTKLLGATSKAKAFQTIYQIPAIRKVHQALGRLVRSPEHKAKILLHCQRFTEPTYQHLLEEVYRPQAIIRSGADLENWSKT